VAAFSPGSLSIGTAQHIVAVKGELFTESALYIYIYIYIYIYVFVFGFLPVTLRRSRHVCNACEQGECCSYSLTSSQCAEWITGMPAMCRVNFHEHGNPCEFQALVWFQELAIKSKMTPRSIKSRNSVCHKITKLCLS
jgi:hypothetical protein